MASVIKGNDNFDTSDNASQIELDGLTNAKNQCTAWVMFEGGTANILDSFNVSSVVRNGAGDYTVNFTLNMLSTSYCPNVTCAPDTAVAWAGVVQLFHTAADVEELPTVSGFRFLTDPTGGIDNDYIAVQVIGGK